MKLLSVFIFCLTVLVAVPASMGQDKVYTWIDENGVLHYTNTEPPEGATIIDTEKELPHDAQKARQQEMERQRYLQRLQRESRPSETQEPGPPESTPGAADQEMDADTGPEEDQVEKDRGRRRNETWHQKQIEKRQREKLNQGPSPPH